MFLPRNGPEFEARIRQNEINNPKFNFLNPNDPYHAYYRHKVSEFKEGKAQEPSAAIPKVMQQQQSAQQQLPQKVSVPSITLGKNLAALEWCHSLGLSRKEARKSGRKSWLYICQNGSRDRLGVECLGLCFDADVHPPGAGNSKSFESAKIQFNWSILVMFSCVLTDRVLTLGNTWTGCGRGRSWESLGVVFGLVACTVL